MNDFYNGLNDSIKDGEEKPADNAAFQEAFGGKAPDPNAEKPQAVLDLEQLFNSKGRVAPKPPTVVGNRNVADAANNLQYWIDRETDKLYFGTPLEYGVEYGGIGLAALGCNPDIDVSGVDTFGYQCGDHVMGDYYIARGYTRENGWIFNDEGHLEYVGAEG